MKFLGKVRKITPPSLNDTAGRTWTECDVILPDGSKVDGYYEIVRGTQFYFHLVGSDPSKCGGHDQWYSAPIDLYDTQESRYVIAPDLRLKQNIGEYCINRKGYMVKV